MASWRTRQRLERSSWTRHWHVGFSRRRRHPGHQEARDADTGRNRAVAPRKQRPQAKLQRHVVEETQEAATPAKERACHKITATSGVPAELRMAAKLGDDWVNIILVADETLPANRAA